MGNVQIVMGIVTAAIGGLGACLVGVKRLDRRHPKTALVGVLLSAAAMFFGIVASAEARTWSYGVGAVLVVVALLWLPGCSLWDRYQRQKQSRARGMWLPEGTIEGDSFNVALTMKINEYNLDASCVSRLPISSMKRAFIAYSIKKRWLNTTEFRKECLSTIEYRDISRFDEMAGLILFVQPIKRAKCRRLFVICSIVLDHLVNAKDDRLVEAVRFAWKTKMFHSYLKQEVTRNALHRLSTENAKFLEYFLVQEHPNDVWVKKYLPPANDTVAPPNGRFESIRTLTRKKWYLEGDIEECQMCSFRPRKGPDFWQPLYKGIRFVFRFTSRCNACDDRAMKRGLCKRSASEEIGHWQTWDTAATASTGSIGFEEMFGK